VFYPRPATELVPADDDAVVNVSLRIFSYLSEATSMPEPKVVAFSLQDRDLRASG